MIRTLSVFAQLGILPSWFWQEEWAWTTWILALLILLGYLLTLLLLPVVLLTKKRQPVSNVAWIMLIVLMPYIGGALFLIFGINRVARRAARKREAKEILQRRLPELSQYQLLAGELPDPICERMSRLAVRIASTRPTMGNDLEILSNTVRTFERITEMVQQAQETVHLEYYIWQPDETGRTLRDILIERARAGLKVRFLYDALGSARLTRTFLQPMRDAGIHVASFLPGISLRERYSINLRNHRKIIVIDGKVGFTGGMNIGDEYLGKNRQFGYWRDTHLQLTGPAVLQLQQVFAEDWFYATGEELTAQSMFPPPQTPGEDVAQVVAGGPYGETEVFHTLFFGAMNEAKERITLATSYFVPTPSLISALESAAFRGLRVRLLVAGRSAHPTTVLAGRSYYDTLLDSGVEIYEYTGGLLHSKTLTIDGVWSFVGTPNFDPRSLFLNFEVGVCLYGRRHAVRLEEQFEEDLNYAEKIDPEAWSHRPALTLMKESFCRMFSPVL